MATNNEDLSHVAYFLWHTGGSDRRCSRDTLTVPGEWIYLEHFWHLKCVTGDWNGFEAILEAGRLVDTYGNMHKLKNYEQQDEERTDKKKAVSGILGSRGARLHTR